MDRYSLIVVTEETAPVRRFEVRKLVVRRALWAAAIGAVVSLVGAVDYVRIRIAHVELNALQIETADQRATIEAFDERLDEVRRELERVQDFERKLRIIANLPGSAASGGETVTEVGTHAEGDLGAAEGGVESIHQGPPEPSATAPPPRANRPDSGAKDPERMSWLYDELKNLDGIADSRGGSLEELIAELEVKHRKLASSPAIWPTKGWLTSRFGPRISPFTGRRQFHSGIDIAGRQGTEVFAPARGVVMFSGKRGPLGNTVILDHGYGVRTHYGHSSEIHVKRGQEVERGQVIASMGSTGRSTGPHLHYAVEVNGKSVNPLDYIFD